MDAKIKFFLIGLAIGLILALVVYILTALRSRSQKNELKKSNQKYKETLATKMEIEGESLGKLKEEIDALKKENENLRVALNIASSKPDAKELARASILQNAVDKVMASSVGFGAVWTQALKESEDEYQDKVLTGKVSFFKRIFSRQGFSSSSPKSIEDKELK